MTADSVQIATDPIVDDSGKGNLKQELNGTGTPTAPAGEEETAPPTAPASREVQRGDSLYKIAKEFYGDANMWPAIALVNGISNPDQIQLGQTLILPSQDQLDEASMHKIAGGFYAFKEQLRQTQEAAAAADLVAAPSPASTPAPASNENGIVPREGLAGNVVGAFAGGGRFLKNTAEGLWDFGKTIYQSYDYMITGDEASRAGYEKAGQIGQGLANLVSDSYDTYAYVATGDAKYRAGYEANAARGDAIIAAAEGWQQRYSAADDYEKSAMLSEAFFNIAAAVVGTKGLGSAKAAGETAALGEIAGTAKTLGTVEEAAALSTQAARTTEVVEAAAGATRAASVPEGSFSIIDWTGYPEGLPKPQGPFRLLEGTEYEAARAEANAANSALRQEMELVGQPVDIHEIQPVKFGGSPTDPANKIVLPRAIHQQQVTPWWNELQKYIQARQ